eukprot:NODE_1418_length_972_cov_47.323944_g978_i0.p2 GENE.NODE_1418_length_972_cov_47.323944_g978_i0~~NODE_1418_length_972_cov_47.323944_g978_i0.p2  ORF type:complete len:69 (-),score=6.25 NODE_1418_length_972_cov_47.323944_g978_i0:350-556(-)
MKFWGIVRAPPPVVAYCANVQSIFGDHGEEEGKKKSPGGILRSQSQNLEQNGGCPFLVPFSKSDDGLD